jgi:hypothetical protein
VVSYCDTIDLDAHSGDAPVASETIVAGLGFPSSVAVDASHVYWADSTFDATPGEIARAPLGGGSGELLSDVSVSNASGLVLLGADVYWSNIQNNNLMRVAKTGGSAEVFFLSGALVDLAGDDSALYAPVGTAVAAYPVPLDAPIDLATGLIQPVTVAGGGSVVWAGDIGVAAGIEYPGGMIHRFAPDGSGGEVVASDVNRPIRVAGNASDVLWLDGGTNAAAGSDGAVMMLAQACGSAPVVLVANVAAAWELHLDGSAIFLSTTDGDVWGVDLKTGAITRYADASPTFPAVAASSSHVYWTASDAGEIRRAAR